MNRDKVEQDAMRLLQRGQTEKALDQYLALLRHEPKDRRIRQKVGELYLTMDRRAEAVRHLTDVAQGLRSDGQVRAAASVYKQLVKLRPDNLELREEFAACLRDLNRRSEARQVYEEAFRLAEKREPAKAIKYAQAVVALAPGEQQLRVRVAELLEQARRNEEAVKAWRSLANDARRRGRAGEQARFLEKALRIDPDDQPVLLDAAEARVRQGEARVALGHLQRAYTKDPRNVRLLSLLGESLQSLGHMEKARKVWIQAARRCEEEDDREGRIKALRHALECAPHDDRLRAEVERADAELRRLSIRLDEQAWARPRTDDEVRALVRATTERRYGFPQRARATLEGAGDDVRAGHPWKVHYAELLADLGEARDAIDVLRSLTDLETSAEGQIATRIRVLGADLPDLPEPEPIEEEPADIIEEELAEDALVDQMVDDLIADDEPLHDELIDDEDTAAEVLAPEGSDVEVDASATEADGDAFAAAGRRSEALAAYRSALGADPSNVDLLRKIGELMSGGTAAVQERAIPLAMPVDDEPDVDFGAAFGEIDPEALDDLDDRVREARAHAEAGLYDDVPGLLRGVADLEAQVVLALAALRSGDVESGKSRLETALQGASEHHPAYVEACWELSGIYLRRRKLGNAERLLDEVEASDPTWRAVEMTARRRALELLRGR